MQHHLERILPAVLTGLADESEGVRGAALAAGRTMVEMYADTALPLLLPAVEEGIVNDAWRIRQSSAELMGDLLFKVRRPARLQRVGECVCGAACWRRPMWALPHVILPLAPATSGPWLAR